MKYQPQHPTPSHGASVKALPPVICYPTDGMPNRLPMPDAAANEAERAQLTKIDELIIPPREARIFDVPAGHFFRIMSVEGPQVGDLNLWAQGNLKEKFYTSKTRQLQGSHLSTGDHMWSSFPYMRPMATISKDTLDWYGFDTHGGAVHDVIGSRCDPYTAKLLSGDSYDHCCHSNLCRALAEHQNISLDEAELYVHDVLNVFMCTGLTLDTRQYFMKETPVRPGDYLEFVANIPLLGGLSACPGGNCAATHSSDEAKCYPLCVEVYKPSEAWLASWEAPAPSAYRLK